MYFHLDSSSFKMGMVGVCTCDTVAGDYSFVDGFQPDGQRSLDMGLFQVASALDDRSTQPMFVTRCLSPDVCHPMFATR
eukprot:SAG11_NODE_3437_length_2448_cov_1.788846_2_plen_79_part_00